MSGVLSGLGAEIAKEWDDFATNGRICLSSLDAIEQQVKLDKAVVLYAVDLDYYEQSTEDILVGFGAKDSALDFNTCIIVKHDQVIVGKVNVVRGRKCLLLPSVLARIGMPNPKSGGKKLSVEAENNKGIFAICAICNDDIRKALAHENYALGSWVYNGQHDFAEKGPGYEGFAVDGVIPNNPRFGGICFRNFETEDAVLKELASHGSY